MLIFDRAAMKDILGNAIFILQKHFFYENDFLKIFVHGFLLRMTIEAKRFIDCTDPEFLDELLNDRLARFEFTCYFTSLRLRECFVEKLNFSEQELEAFDNILPKCTGENAYETEPKR